MYLHAFDEYIVKELLSTYNRGKNKEVFYVFIKRYQFYKEEKAFFKKYPSFKLVLKELNTNEFVLEEKNL